MNFNFIPYRLNTDVADIKDEIQYINADNEVELYKAREELLKPILGLQISGINFYFFERKLITVYIHLVQISEHKNEVREIIENAIKCKGKTIKTDSGVVYGWSNETEFLGLLNVEKGKKLYLYNSLKKYSVF